MDDDKSETKTVGTSAEDQVNAIGKQFFNHIFNNADCDSDNDEAEVNCFAFILKRYHLHEIKNLNLQVQFGNVEIKALVDSGSVCAVIRKPLAKAMINGDEYRFRMSTTVKQDLKFFANEAIKNVGVAVTTVICNHWKAENVKINVVEDGQRSVIGRELFKF